jgi:hypothetical protein
MQKQEFPTFLNEQPTVIFGRTGRELLIMACGCVAGYNLWQKISPLIPAAWWEILSVILAALLVLISIIVALVPIASRPLEEWLICWALYTFMPKLYLYKPLETEAEDPIAQKYTRAEAKQKRQTQKNETITDEED